jgi:hypothetical protein
MQITICGGGNAAHTLAGLLGANPEVQVNLYVPLEEEERRWQEGLSANGGINVHLPDRSLAGRPAKVSAQPAEVIAGSDIVLLALPAFAHELVLGQIAPHLDRGTWLGALPARGGFDWSAFSCLGSRAKDLTLFGLQTLPWACRIEQFGRSVNVMGVKARVELAARPEGMALEVANLLGPLLGLELEPVECFLCLTLASTGQILHPGLMYALFKDWNGQPYEQAPLFYQGADAEASRLLQGLSDEVAALRAALEGGFPCLDFSLVRPLDEWLRRSYPEDIADTSSLQACLATNRSYAGLAAPMVTVPGGLAPDFGSRYLREDVPYGLVVTRGIAELAGLHTPIMDEVITWSQERLGLEFIRSGRLVGQDLPSTRAPQRFHIKTINQLTNSNGRV